MTNWLLRHMIQILMCCLISSPCFASDSIKNKLNDIITKIKTVQELLQTHHSKQTGLEKNLKSTEMAINQLHLKIDGTTHSLSQQQEIINKLALQQQKILHNLGHKQQTLLRHVKTRYLLGLNKKQAHILLTTKNPEKIDRVLMYNRYLTLQSKNMIQHLNQDLEKLNINKQAILRHQNELQQLQEDQRLQYLAMDTNKRKQQSTLQSLSAQVKNNTEELEHLLKNKKNLENIIVQLQRKETYQSDFLTHHKGKFPWPTLGRALEKFGSSIEHSELKQTGIIIAAPEGQNVYAVARGKVIFASWLPGYGLLLIIDHGKNYMTLYGNNNTLYKKTNDMVSDHELIAKVGHTGGRQKSALYFALRFKGKAIDPCTWCGSL